MSFYLNTLRPRQNGRHFADAIFKCVFLNGNVWILIKISLKFVLQGLINNNPALVQVMAWRRPGDKPLSEAMMVRLPRHICVTRPQWVNQMLTQFTHSYMWHWVEMSWDRCSTVVYNVYIILLRYGKQIHSLANWIRQTELPASTWYRCIT